MVSNDQNTHNKFIFFSISGQQDVGKDPVKCHHHH